MYVGINKSSASIEFRSHFTMEVIVDDSNVKYSDEYIDARYAYTAVHVSESQNDGTTHVTATPTRVLLDIQTRRRVPRVGVMLVGWGGNNGSTLTAAHLANKHRLQWETKKGLQTANWFGSITQASTLRLGTDPTGGDYYVPLKTLLPMVEPADLVFDGWDISGANLYEACQRACVLEPLLLAQLKCELAALKPRASVYNADFIALNQADRADHLIPGSKSEQVAAIQRDIADFRCTAGVDEVIVLWTANTERFSEIIPGVHDTLTHLENAIAADHAEIAPSVLFAYAAITSGCTYINGSPQNTFVPAIIELAAARGVFIAGDDFKSGQTKLKSVLVDFLVNAGIKPVSIVSYNHLGNNDGKNLSAPQQFRAKEVSKSNVVDDVVASNALLYGDGERPDHCVVIKYVPYVGDSKRAMDEYTSEIMMGGVNTFVVHNTCEDSLLAAPIILDLIVLAELCERIRFKRAEDDDAEYEGFHSILSLLGYLCKAPLTPKGVPVVNSLFRQRACIENVLRACVGLPPDHNMQLETKVRAMSAPIDE